MSLSSMEYLHVLEHASHMQMFSVQCFMSRPQSIPFVSKVWIEFQLDQLLVSYAHLWKGENLLAQTLQVSYFTQAFACLSSPHM
jgi:hypothetical protein